MPDVRKVLTDFISSNYIRGREIQNLDEASFLDAGIIDSVAVIEIVTFVEEAFKIRVEDAEITPENLDSINKLERYVKHKLSEVPNKE